MEVQKDFLVRFIIYPVFFLTGVIVLCTIRNNWEDLDTTVGILLAYYILMSFWFYYDLRKMEK